MVHLAIYDISTWLLATSFAEVPRGELLGGLTKGGGDKKGPCEGPSVLPSFIFCKWYCTLYSSNLVGKLNICFHTYWCLLQNFVSSVTTYGHTPSTTIYMFVFDFEPGGQQQSGS